jgi:hypothetical protein
MEIIRIVQTTRENNYKNVWKIILGDGVGGGGHGPPCLQLSSIITRE